MFARSVAAARSGPDGLAVVIVAVECPRRHLCCAVRLPLLHLLRLLVVVRVLLPELFLRRGDQAEIVLGVLVVVLGRDRIAGTLRVARELDIFLRDVGGGAADFHVGAVGLVNPRQRILWLFARDYCRRVRACACSDRFS